jgi:hypothetical protein
MGNWYLKNSQSENFSKEAKAVPKAVGEQWR